MSDDEQHPTGTGAAAPGSGGEGALPPADGVSVPPAADGMDAARAGDGAVPTESGGDDGPAGGKEGTVARFKKTATRAQERLDDYRTRYWLVDFLFGFTERDRDVAGSVIASALAFRLFLVLVPFVVVLVGILSAFRDLSTLSTQKAVETLGMIGFAADAVSEASSMTGGQIWWALTLGLFGLLWASHWTTTTLRTVHALAWGMKVQRWPHAFKATLSFIGFAFLFVVVAAAFSKGAEVSFLLRVLSSIGSIVLMAGVWMLVSWLLPHPPIRWYDIVPGSALVGLGIWLLQLATFYFVWRTGTSSSLYGVLGLALVLLVWLYFASRLIVAAAMLNERMRFRRTGVRLGRTLLGGQVTDTLAASDDRRTDTDDAEPPEEGPR